MKVELTQRIMDFELCFVTVFTLLGFLAAVLNAVKTTLAKQKIKRKKRRKSCLDLIQISLGTVNLMTGIFFLVSGTIHVTFLSYALPLRYNIKLLHSVIFIAGEFSLFSSLLHVILIMIDRLLVIFYPLQHDTLGKSRIKIFIPLIWVLSGIATGLVNLSTNGFQLSAQIAAGILFVQFISSMILYCTYQRENRLMFAVGRHKSPETDSNGNKTIYTIRSIEKSPPDENNKIQIVPCTVLSQLKTRHRYVIRTFNIILLYLTCKLPIAVLPFFSRKLQGHFEFFMTCLVTLNIVLEPILYFLMISNKV